MRHVVTTLLAAAAFLLLPAAGAAADTPETLHYFWGDGCPVCDTSNAWLDDEFADTHPEITVERHEVWNDPANQQRFVDTLTGLGRQPEAVPTFVLGEQVWVGFTDDIAADIDAAAAELAPDEELSRATVDLGPLGEFDAAAQPLLGATALIGFVDGFNPCSLWVLTVLLAMVLPSRSRARIALVGGTFLLVTATIYGVFISGVFAAFAVGRHLSWLYPAVAALALGFAAVNLKDYFRGMGGFSLSIPDRFKPKVFRGGRRLRTEQSLPALLAFTVVFAAGIAFIELPCTAGFPMVWSGLLNDAGVSTAGFAGLLAVYLAVYLAVELVLLTAAVVTLRAARMQETHGRTLKLVGGTVMAAIAVTLLVDPTLMESFTGALGVITAGLLAALAILTTDRIRGVQRG